MINNAAAAGMIFVAACNNQDVITYPASVNHFSGTRTGTGKDTNTPVIAVCGRNTGALCALLAGPARTFKADGYHAVAAADQCRGVLFGCEYIPLLPGDRSGLHSLFSLYCADILLISFSYRQNEKGYLEEIAKHVLVDIEKSFCIHRLRKKGSTGNRLPIVMGPAVLTNSTERSGFSFQKYRGTVSEAEITGNHLFCAVIHCSECRKHNNCARAADCLHLSGKRLFA